MKSETDVRAICCRYAILVNQAICFSFEAKGSVREVLNFPLTEPENK